MMRFAILSYGSAALAYGVLTLLLVLSRRSVGQGRRLMTVAGGTAVWGLAVAVALGYLGGRVSPLVYAADAGRALLWTLYLLGCLHQVSGHTWDRSTRALAGMALLLAAIAVVGAEVAPTTQTAHFALLGSSVLGCLMVEQIFRNSTDEQKRLLKPFLWAVAGLFGYDLFVFSDALLVRSLDPFLWAGRGILSALAVPLLLLAAKREPAWTRTLFISRQFVFYSATLTGVGMYLIAMALVGALLREGGGQWGASEQLVFFVAALAVLALVLSSQRLRTNARVFITKHFYRHQYEYRDEWLKLIRTLSASDLDLPLDQRSIKALADIINSPGGQLWLSQGKGRYEPFAAWQAPFPPREIEADSPLVRFLSTRQWVIDSDEYARDPERYDHSFATPDASLPEHSVIVPLFQQTELLGFMVLRRLPGMRALTFEDHDLLKTAGRQVAAFLAHDLAMEQLAETRQFEAYSKLSAFVLHDLKNLLSQQTMLVDNAKRHQHRPEFVADVIKTVDNGVQRMRRLLSQLQGGGTAVPEQRVELNALVKDVLASSRGLGASYSGDLPVWVHAQPDRLASVISHVIVNAHEATKGGGAVAVTVAVRDGRAVIEVRDEGEGMSEDFVRRRLFKPFDTTKGSSGMGIGVYQAREVVRALGGDIDIKSELGKGTTVLLSLPIASSPADGRQLSGSIG